MSYPFITIWLGDYHRDTRLLNAEEHGAYLLLLFELWNSEGLLVLDHAALAQIARVTPKRWPKVWERLQGYFLVTYASPFPYIRHKRIDEELAKADLSSDKRRNAGRKGGLKTSLRYKGDGEAMLQQSPSKSSPSPKEHPPADVERRAVSSFQPIPINRNKV